MDDFDDDGDDLLCSVEMANMSASLKQDQFALDVDGDNMIAAVQVTLGTKLAACQDPPVEVPEKFSFPFEPYDIQVGFMKDLYRCLELGKIGIFESPTGTGKSLSLICGALRWLKDFQEKKKSELEKLLTQDTDNSEENKENTSSNQELDWISAFEKKQEVEDKSKKIKVTATPQNGSRAPEEAELSLKRESRLSQMRKSRGGNKRKRVQLEDEFDELLKSASADIKDAYQSEIQQQGGEGGSLDDDDSNLVVAEYNSDDGEEDSDGEKEGEEEYHCTKIYFCSRTHSQLSQFVREVVKSPYGDDTRVISLGSRQNLCVNGAVKKLKSLTLINETCRDLQKKKSGAKPTSDTKRKRTGAGGSQGCPYYRQDPIEDFRDAALVEVRDIEQLVGLGQQLKACPYYGTRKAIPEAEIVALPYNTLLHRSTREASGIQLKDNIIIIDEAHNLLETINSVHSVQVTAAQLVKAHSQLCQYEAKFRSRLKAQNLMYIKQILFILGKLTHCLGGKTDQPADKQTCRSTEQKLWTINDFLFSSQLDNVNMFKVLRYCHRSQIARKLHGFVEKYQTEIVQTEKEKKEESAISSVSKFLKSLSGKNDNSSEPEPESAPDDRKDAVFGSPLMHIEGFLGALTSADKDGRIVLTKTKLLSQCSIKFLLLNPAVHFASVLQEARAVVVAGGTMQPVSEFKDQLFHAAGVSPERILEYSCGHVISSDQILPIAVSSGPTEVQLDFTYQHRTNPKLLDEVGRCVQNVCSTVPGGVICFFPSYDYEKLVHSHWENTGLIARLETKKKVFREPRRAGQVDQVLHEYSACIQKRSGSVTGSLLLCVVGGKMSEGINFSDDLGRCVIMIGMPYPNIHSPELKEKMDYLNANFPRDSEGRQPGQVHYENLCMKAVNQSIGRAIRHRNDYATILMLDRRYSRAGTVARLPGWISQHLHKMDKFGSVFAAVTKFFSSKKTS